MNLVLPRGKTLLDLRGAPDLSTVEQWVRTNVCPEGYLQLQGDRHTDLLLFYRGSMHSAVRSDHHSYQRISLLEFFGGYKKEDIRRTGLFRSDTGLILLLTVALQNQPLIRCPCELVDIRAVLQHLRESSQSAVLRMSRVNQSALAFVSRGIPTAMYIPGVMPITAQYAEEEIRHYCDPKVKGTVLEVFTDLKSAPDHYSAASVNTLLAGEPGTPSFFVSVRHNGAVVQQRMIKTGSVEIGRAPTCDLIIDHSTVSREHCRILWKKTRFVVEDAGSANGTLVNGTPITSTTLHMGDELKVGDFDVSLGEQETIAGPGTLETVFISKAADIDATLQFDGNTIALDRPVATLGKADDATIQLKGWRTAKVEATVVREARTYRVFPAPGGKPVSVNGVPTPELGALLNNGDEIQIGSNRIQFGLGSGEAHSA